MSSQRRSAQGLACAVAVFVLSSQGVAAPAGWPGSKARSVALKSLERLERRLALGGGNAIEPNVRRDLLRVVLAMAQRERSLELGEPRATLLVAELLASIDARHGKEAVTLFQKVIRRSSDPTVRERAWLGLARVASRERHEARALHAFHEALALAWSEERRALIHLERALAELRFANLGAAIQDCRLALVLSHVDSLRFEAAMLLAVAYERRADLPAALSVIGRALLGGRPKDGPSNILGTEWNTDLAPAEVAYAEALVAMGAAESKGNLGQRRRAYAAAIRYWEEYLRLTSAARESFGINAEYHLRACREALERLPAAGRALNEPAPD